MNRSRHTDVRKVVRFLTVLCVLIGALSWSAATASGSELFARDAKDVKLAVSADGQSALLTFKAPTANGNGQVTKRILVSGAVNAVQPSETTPQVQFNQRYLTTGAKDKKVWKNFKNKCKSYDGPDLAFLVVACK